MTRYALSRLIALAPVLALVLLIIFALARIIPGDPAVTLLGPGATREQIDMLRAQLRLDEPAPTQLFSYVAGLFQGDLGRSMKSGQPVLQEILLRLPATLELSILATLLAIAVGIPIGVLSAIRSNSAVDHVVRVVSLVGVSIPAFLFALILQLVFGIWLGWLPVSGRSSPFFIVEPLTGFAILDAVIWRDWELLGDALAHLILPTLVLAAFLGATLGRFVRNTMIEVMTEDYIRTARAKGLKEQAVLFGHGLRNALLPAITIVGLKFAEMLGGAILTETVFAWPGVGRFMFEAIRNRDYPVIQGATLLFALMFMLVSLLVDLLYGLIDPRIRRRMG